MKIGILSDTHGLLRPEVLPAFAGVEHILHAGDVGNADILMALRAVAPVTAIRGNIDTHGPCAELSATAAVELAGCFLYVLHNIADLDLKPQSAGMDVVIYGHTHRPSVEIRDQVLYLNPGSAGPRRFQLPVTVAILQIEDRTPTANIVTLLD